MNKIIDLHHHLDTLPKIGLLRSKLQGHKYTIDEYIKEDTQVTISVAVYVPLFKSYEDIVLLIKQIHKIIESLGEDVKLIKTKSDLDSHYKLGIILHVESARLIKNPASQLDELFDLGIRGIIPLHFVDNHLGQSCDDPMRRFGIKKNDIGLTDEGYRFIEHMNRLHMWVDVSHTTDQTAKDILDTANEVMASHIGLRDIVNKARNKELSFLQKLSEKKGIFGLIPWQHLINTNEDAYYEQIKLSLDSNLQDSICLGTDLGAPIKTHQNIKSLFDCAAIADRFDHEAKKIKYLNAYTFFKRVLPS